MSYNWINAKDYTMNSFLLFDRWALQWIFTDCGVYDWFPSEGRDYKLDMAKALFRYPHVAWYVRNKAPECASFLDEIQAISGENWTEEEMREAETAILQAHETFVVYAFPKVMEQVNYIRNWDEKYLHELVDLTDKLVLDVGSGTGRLAFASAKKARRVYASEPCDCLREYMRDRIKAEGISNVRVLDGEVLSLPYEDDSFDVVMSGHVIGDHYEEEIAEITRITKDGGWLVICDGDDETRRTAPDPELVSRGFEWFRHESVEGGIIYNYRKQVKRMNNNTMIKKEIQNDRHDTKTGRICEVQKNSYAIKFMGQELPATLNRHFYEEEADKLPVVGDYVTFRHNPDGDSIILSVCERKSFLQRPDQSKMGVMQYMVANVDYCFIVTSLNDDYSYNRIGRYASVALQGGAIPVAILTKADLCTNVGRYVSEVETISDKIRVHAISALYDIGMDELKEYLVPGTTICLMGSSGAGKSTLLNSLTGEETMKTSAIRESDSKGRHTTTCRHLIELENGVSIIDTPGMREIGMAQTEEAIDDIFSDIMELESRCKFSDCRHDTEPGCAIKKALEDGSLSMERYMLYQNLGAENQRNYAKKKQISILVKQRRKYGLESRGRFFG